ERSTVMTFHLLAVHGAGMNAAVWGGVAPHLAAAGHGHFQAVTLPGHGADGSAALDGIDAMARWLCARIDALPGNERVILLGHSMGALAALAAAHHPRVAGTVALGAADRMPVHPDLL